MQQGLRHRKGVTAFDLSRFIRVCLGARQQRKKNPFKSQVPERRMPLQ